MLFSDRIGKILDVSPGIRQRRARNDAGTRALLGGRLPKRRGYRPAAYYTDLKKKWKILRCAQDNKYAGVVMSEASRIVSVSDLRSALEINRETLPARRQAASP